MTQRDDAAASAAEAGSTRPSGPRIALSLVLGILTGLVVNYALAAAVAVRVPVNYTLSPLALALIALVGAAAVVIAWRWPVGGLTAGLVILLLVVVGVAQRWGWLSAESAQLDPFNAVVFGTVNGSPVLVGAVMATASGLRLRARRG